MIRKLSSGQYRLYSRKIDPKTRPRSRRPEPPRRSAGYAAFFFRSWRAGASLCSKKSKKKSWSGPIWFRMM